MKSHDNIGNVPFSGDTGDCIRDIYVVSQQFVQVDVRSCGDRSGGFEYFLAPFFQSGISGLVVDSVQGVYFVVIFRGFDLVPESDQFGCTLLI